MKINLELEIKNFRTPNYVRSIRSSEEPALGDEIIHIRDIDEATLHDLCDEFKREIFRKAGKGLIFNGKR